MPAQPPSADTNIFVGRETELKALHEAFRATDAGKPVAVRVPGLSGMGKSALVDRFLSQVRRDSDAVILTGRCYERESVPFFFDPHMESVIAPLVPDPAGAAAPEPVHYGRYLMSGLDANYDYRRQEEKASGG